MVTDMEIIIRLVLATVAGLLIGFCRRKKAAGIRTFSLISLGSAIFTVVSISGPTADAINYDPMRVIAQIVAGIGFLGLGVIWKTHGDKPSGLTTAAAIWVTAAVGVLMGLGMWIEAGAGFIMTFLVLLAKDPLKKAGLEE